MGYICPNTTTMATVAAVASNKITVTPGSGPVQEHSLSGASASIVPPRPNLPSGSGGQVLSTMPAAGTPANVPAQQYSNIPQQWKVLVKLDNAHKELVLEPGPNLNFTGIGVTVNSAAGAEAVRVAIAAGIP